MITPDEIRAWFAGRVPTDWFVVPPEVTTDSEEVLIVGVLADVASGSTAEADRAAREARIKRFREESREQRMKIATEGELRFERRISWGAECGDVRRLFTTISVPVMTRLRLDERGVLDTLVDSGVARSRSDALAWCVRLVAKHQSDWIQSLRDALVKVEEVRSQGPR